jgi:hypothetical protein
MNTSSDHDDLFPILGFFAFVVIVVSQIIFSLIRSRRALARWADHSGFIILYSEARHLVFAGPFKWRLSNWRRIYFVKVRDQTGHEHSGWVCCGSFFGGIWPRDTVEVRWDEA